ncbi:MAG TPA: hypothetical protein VEO55_02030 [Candidatus Dormibacteraeota bacterium]|nr:hypothetical protein [Candidatus Dormibacteraeota bacterium]
MLISDGDFRYEIRRAGELIATEEESLAAGKIRGVRHPASGSNVYEVEAELDPDALIRRLVVRYSRGPFVRNATYESSDDFLRGNVSAMGSRNNLTTKLGRYREVDADLVIFRALTIAHIRARGQSRWTGRIAAIDTNTLVAATSKQTCRQRGDDPHVWIYEPRMGDSEEITIDDSGWVLRRHDARGIDTILVSRTPASGAAT